MSDSFSKHICVKARKCLGSPDVAPSPAKEPMASYPYLNIDMGNKEEEEEFKTEKRSLLFQSLPSLLSLSYLRG